MIAQCPFCRSTAPSSEILDAHVRAAHPDPWTMQAQRCPECGNPVEDAYWNDHMARHREARGMLQITTSNGTQLQSQPSLKAMCNVCGLPWAPGEHYHYDVPAPGKDVSPITGEPKRRIKVQRP